MNVFIYKSFDGLSQHNVNPATENVNFVVAFIDITVCSFIRFGAPKYMIVLYLVSVYAGHFSFMSFCLSLYLPTLPSPFLCPVCAPSQSTCVSLRLFCL